jgi:hypothetical protein
MIRSSNLTQFTCGLLTVLSALAGCSPAATAADPAEAVDGVILFTDGETSGNGMLAGPMSFTGGWYAFDDHKDCRQEGTPEGEVTNPSTAEGSPVFTAYDADPAPAEGEQKSNKRGIHLVASAHTFFSAGIGVAFKVGPKPVDLTTEKLIGVRFLAKSAMQATVEVKLTDTASEPGGGICAENSFAKGCPGVMAGGMLVENKDQGCFNAALATVELTSQWQEFRVFFNKKVSDDAATAAKEIGPMVRGNFGVVAADGSAIDNTTFPLQVDEAYQFQIQTGSDPVDMWMDNFGLIIEGGVADTGTAG